MRINMPERQWSNSIQRPPAVAQTMTSGRRRARLLAILSSLGRKKFLHLTSKSSSDARPKLASQPKDRGLMVAYMRGRWHHSSCQAPKRKGCKDCELLRGRSERECLLGLEAGDNVGPVRLDQVNSHRQAVECEIRTIVQELGSIFRRLLRE